MATGEFVVTRGGRESFHDEESLRRLAAAGQLDPGDLVYHPMLGRWLYAREVEEVREELRRATALGRPVAAAPAMRRPANHHAEAGFALALFGIVPLLGLVTTLFAVGLCVSGLFRAGALGGRGRALAITGLALSILFVLPTIAFIALIGR
jgi:hypothetical protein